MRKKISPWLAAAATAAFISVAAPAGKEVHADELIKQGKTTVSVSSEDDNSEDLADESEKDNEDSVVDTADSEVNKTLESEVNKTTEVVETAEERKNTVFSTDAKKQENIIDISVKAYENTDKEDEETGENADKTGEKTDENIDKEDEKAAEDAGKEDERTEENADKEDEETDENIDKEDEKAAENAGKEDERTEENADKEDKKIVENKDKEAAGSKEAEKKNADITKEEVTAVVTNDESKAAKANGWVKDGDKWKYYFGDGEDQYYRGESVDINGNRYVFDSNGNMRTGWIKNNETGEYCYALPSGRLAQGWMNVDGKWYHFGDHDDYSFEIEGYNMLADKEFIYMPIENSYKACYFTLNGAMMTGWGKDGNGDWYHAESDGELDQGWKLIDDKYYYFGEPSAVPVYAGAGSIQRIDGFKMIKGRVASIKGEYYSFSDSGAMQTGWIKGNGIDKNGIDKKVYAYANPSGRLVVGYKEIDGEEYCFHITKEIEVYKDERGVLRSKYNVKVLNDKPIVYLSEADTSENKKKDASDLTGSLTWPVYSSVITSSFSSEPQYNPVTEMEQAHNGVDIACEVGSSVKAPAAGTIVSVDDSVKDGKTIKIDAGNDIIITFKHLSECKCKVGDKVTAGQEIALSGNTGAVTGPCLHFEISISGEYVDPTQFFN